jgi:ribose transport system ATP-binding protein
MTQADTSLTAGTCPPDDHVLRITDLSKTFGGTAALREVSFSIGRGEVHALLGGNGSGKSTLIKILAGVHQGDSGTIEASGSTVDARQTTPGWAYSSGLRFVHQAMGTFADFTVAENFALGSSYGHRAIAPVNWRRLNDRVSATLDRFDLAVSPKARMGDLRKAEQTLVAIARALEDESRSAILVLDEPTAALPAHEVEQVHRAILGYVARGHTVVMVSHRVDEVLAVATQVTFLRDGMHLSTQAMEGMDEQTIVQHIAGMENFARPPARHVERVSPVLEVDGLAVGALTDVSFSLYPGEIVGVSGLVGSGRSSLLRCLAGLAKRRAGTIVLDDETLNERMRPDQAIRKGIAYIPEDRAQDAAFPERPVRENVTAPRIGEFWRRGRVSRSAEQAVTATAIKRYKVVTSSTEADFSSLSGGNQQKIVLARWLELKPRLLLLDDPSQGVDVGARNVLHGLIREAADSGVAVIVASSDARELSDLSDRVIGLSDGQICGEVAGEMLSPQACVALTHGGGTQPERTAAGSVANGRRKL